MIHASWKNGVKKLINLGSSCIYPKEAPQPLKEEYLLSGYLEPTNDAYAIAKIAAIKMCNAYNEQKHTNYFSAMPTNLYGPGDNFNLETSHVLPAIIRKMHLGKCLEKEDWPAIFNDFTRRPVDGFTGKISVDSMIYLLKRYGISADGQKVIITLWGDGSPYREFLYTDDLAEAIVFLVENINADDLKEGFLNVGSGYDLTIKSLSEIIKEIVGFNGEIRWDGSKPNGTFRKLLDASIIESFGWKHKTSLKTGIEKEYNWYLNNLL